MIRLILASFNEKVNIIDKKSHIMLVSFNCWTYGNSAYGYTDQGFGKEIRNN